MAPQSDPLDRGVSELLAAFDAGGRAPAGGSAAAVVVALAAALVGKAARHSRAQWPEAGGAGGQARALELRAAPLARADAEAYAAAVAALGERVGEGAAERDEQLGAALAGAAVIPLRIAETGADVAELAALATERVNPDLRGDALAAVLLAEAATGAAARLVELNLGTTAADPRAAQARELLARARGAARGALAACGP